MKVIPSYIRLLMKVVINAYISVLLVLFFGGIAYILCGCTLCFQNISTHGTATDLVDDTQSNTPTVDTNITASAIPPKFLRMTGPAAPIGPK